MGLDIKHIFFSLPLAFLVACFVQEKPFKSLYDLDKALHSENVAPVVIIGSGPAGLSAALYVARAGMKSFVFAGPQPLGQLTTTTYIENWPGREKILGPDLMLDMKKQALSFGAEIIYDTIIDIDCKNWPFSIKTEEGRFFKAMTIILATGATPRRLNIPGEQEYFGQGVTTCAVCDACFCKGKDVVISGGGDSAAEMVFELAPFAKHITMLVRKDKMRAANSIQERVMAVGNVSVEYNKEIVHIYGDGSEVTSIDVYDNKSQKTERRDIDKVFLAIGHDPNNQMLKGQVPLNETGYVDMVGRSQKTKKPGIFAAGEIQDSTYRQAIIAAGEGAKAALDATSFLYALGFNAEIGHKLDQKFFQAFSDEKIEIEDIFERSEFDAKIWNSKGLVLLEYYEQVCPGCMQMAPVVESVAYKLKDKLKVYKMDFDKTKKTIWKDLWFDHEIKVNNFPMLLVFKNGKFVEKTSKIMKRPELLAYLQKFL